MHTLLKTDPWFASLPEEFAHFLLSSGQCTTLGMNEYVFRNGESDNGLFVLLEGLICISNINLEGEEAILAVLNKGIWFGEVSLIDGAPRTHDARCITESRLLHVPSLCLRQFLADNPVYWQHIAQLVSNKLRLIFSAYEVLQTLPAHERVIRQLLMLGRNYTEQTVSTTRLPINQLILSQLAATSRQTCNQSLKKLAALHIIKLNYQHIEVLDWPALMRLST
ncbi:Crp/Fnr family transcriptional regulator [Pseudoalteromonas ulvae]|uniref:Crp/Fnr family transcriptional regulator n=1 Tax=Pseudoalteromonas ulvae TaxID=107327 RepID=A0A244CR34_PSEDV|nr:Crp/Fnr family transcriptional regulator [Pseudoalteromonas ulvae]OUL58083.1 hypothetical protein B1199_06935 [Pseudoalteromonas ulvae]